MKRWDRRAAIILGAFVVLSTTAISTSPAFAKEPLVIFLVRHAEKVDTSRDPELSAAGKKRAADLADVLRDVQLTHIHSSDYQRTRDTARPIAARLKSKVIVYDRRDLPKLVSELRRTGGRHLVVGHSTTTPRVVALLGGKPGTAIHEPSEFDRLYIVTVDENGKASTVLLRYGEKSKNSPAKRP